jgi:hypothetical protein
MSGDIFEVSCNKPTINEMMVICGHYESTMRRAMLNRAVAASKRG